MTNKHLLLRLIHSFFTTCFWQVWFTVSIIFLCTVLSAQTWHRQLDLQSHDFATQTLLLPDHGYLLVGHTGDGATNQDIHLRKLDEDGETQWSQTFGSTKYDEAIAAVVAPDGGFVLAGFTFDTGDNSGDVLLVKTDRLGKVEWWKTHGTTAFEQAKDIIQTSDGGYAIVGRSGGDDADILLLKTDGQGNEMWSHHYGGLEEDIGVGVVEMADGGIVLLGNSSSFGNGDRDFYLLKTNSAGVFQWFEVLGGAEHDFPFDLKNAPDGGLLLSGVSKSFNNGGFDLYLIKTDAEGQQEWSKTYGNPTDEWSGYLGLLEDGYVLVGATKLSNTANEDLFVVRTDLGGTELWSKSLGEVARKEIGVSVEITDNQDFIITAQNRLDDDMSILDGDFFVLKMDASGNILTNTIEGRVFFDENENCAEDGGEVPLKNWLIEAVGASGRFYNLTDENGNYHIQVDTGEFELILHPPNTYWQACDNFITNTFSTTFDTLEIHFPIKPGVDCPYLVVDVATDFLIPCEDSDYTVTYQNLGTTLAENAIVTIQLDDSLQFNSATLLPLSQVGNLLTFDVGNLSINASGSFQFNATLACEALQGRTHCVEAYIQPDSICAPLDPEWDGSSVVVNAVCEGDSIIFTIKNEGDGNMEEPQLFIIVEDQIIGRAGDFQLLAGETKTLVEYPNGKTLRLEADQSFGHPGQSRPSVTVEACNNNGGTVSLGYATQRPEDDGNAFHSIDCRESGMPTLAQEKLAFPKGIDTQHFIKTQTDIEYLIRFQNSGSDTAVQVIIRDTLSPFLDLISVRPGAASHPYEMEISNMGILKFTFNNILLPDSMTNAVASHGFLKFRVSQQPDNPFDSLILNRPSISFDYQAPVATNIAFHTIIKPETYNLIGVSLCSGGTYNGIVFQDDAFFSDTTVFASFDSITLTNLYILPASTFAQAARICNGDFFEIGTSVYEQSGIYIDTIAAFNTCDSIVTTTLEVLPTFEVLIDTLLESGAFFRGIPHFSDTTWMENWLTVDGCDSLLMVEVSVISNTSQTSGLLTTIETFPNPVSEQLFIEFVLTQSAPLNMEIYDFLGQKMQTLFRNEVYSEGKYQLNIPISDWEQGVYLIAFQVGTQHFFRSFIVVD